MKIFLQIIFFLIAISCSSQNYHCAYIGEITLLHVEEEVDKKLICECYSENRMLFAELRDSLNYDPTDDILSLLARKNVSEKARYSFTENYVLVAFQHRKSAIIRKPIYEEGVDCLEDLISNNLSNYKQYVVHSTSRIKKLLTQSDSDYIVNGIEKYLKFNTNKRNQFHDEILFEYEKLAMPVVEYNNLSFNIINDHVLTSQYWFGLPFGYKQRLLSIVNDSPELLKEFEKYSIIEEEAVSKIQSEQCYKAYGIMRYYENLSDEQKVKAQKVNMLMNFLR